jgi:hypothetical protein
MAKAKTPPVDNAADEQELNIRFVPTQTPVRLYANNVQIGFSTWDMWMVFGEVMGREGDELLVEPRARVSMSLEHAKAFAEVLSMNIAKFEEEVGKIPAFHVRPPKAE